MKIIHVISTLNLGGAENFTVQLANAQSTANEVLIITLNTSHKSHSYISKIDSKIKFFELKWKKKYSFKQFIELYRLLKKLKVDLVHVHLHNPFYYVYGASFINNKLKYIHTVHNSFNVWNPILKQLNRLRFINNKILHICLSSSIHEEVKYHFPKLKTTYVENGIAPYQFTRSLEEINDFWNSRIEPSDSHIRFLIIANNSPFKNLNLLAKVCHILSTTHSQVSCLVIGGASQDDLSLMSDNILFAGIQKAAADFIVGADALWITSIEEGMPIVALEALSLGKPIITTPAGGMKDLIKNNVNGFVAQDFTATSFMKSVSNFLKLSEVERTTLSRSAKDSFYSRYTIDSISQSYSNAYTTLL